MSTKDQTTTDYCKFDDCDNPAIFYIAYGCIEQHIADSKVCRNHLNAFRTLVDDKKMRCGLCPRPIISGLYRLIRTHAKRICVRNLTGQTVKIVDNPEYTDPVPGLIAAAEAMDKLNQATITARNKCPCPDGHLGKHKFSCPIPRHQDWDSIIIPKGNRKTSTLKYFEEKYLKEHE